MGDLYGRLPKTPEDARRVFMGYEQSFNPIIKQPSSIWNPEYSIGPDANLELAAAWWNENWLGVLFTTPLRLTENIRLHPNIYRREDGTFDEEQMVQVGEVPSPMTPSRGAGAPL